MIHRAHTVKARAILGDGSSSRVVAAGAASLRSPQRLYEAGGVTVA